jgi:hypothetical protein
VRAREPRQREDGDDGTDHWIGPSTRTS